MPDPKPPVAEMKRLLFARIAELRELEGRATKGRLRLDSTLRRRERPRVGCREISTESSPFWIAQVQGFTEENKGEYLANAQLIIASWNIFRASLDAHEAFLKQECHECLESGVLLHDSLWFNLDAEDENADQPCPCNRPAQIQALYEALCGGEK